MDREDIYIKTEKATDEIQNRKYRLPQAMRSLLIMIDGTKTIGAYLDRAVALGDVSKMLIELEKQGFIQRSSEASRTRVSTPHEGKPLETADPGKAPAKTGGGMIDLGTLFTPASEQKNKKEKN